MPSPLRLRGDAGAANCIAFSLFLACASSMKRLTPAMLITSTDDDVYSLFYTHAVSIYFLLLLLGLLPLSVVRLTLLDIGQKTTSCRSVKSMANSEHPNPVIAFL